MTRAAPILLLLALGCGKDPPRDDRMPSTEDSGPSTDDSAAPFGDNLTALGAAPESGFPPELTGVLTREDGWVFACAGTTPMLVYDARNPGSPARVAQLNFPLNSGGFRCQHLSFAGGDRLLATHHGDETSPPWIGLADISDPASPLGLSSWSDGRTALSGVVVDGDTAFVAARQDGVLVFELSTGVLNNPDTLPNVTGNAVSVALRGDTLAVGTLEGEVQLLSTRGEPLAKIPVSGAAYDLVWLDDDALVVAVGAGGLDRLSVSGGAITAHADTYSPALDLAALGDGALAVAAWSEILVFDPETLTLLGAENPAGAGQEAVVLALDALGDTLYVGDWQTLLTYRWDPTVSAPDLALDVFNVDFGAAPPGEAVAAAVVLRNRGPKALELTGISVSDPALSVDRATLTIPAYGADFVELSWVSTGMELRAELVLTSADPDEGELRLDVYANRPGISVGQRLPSFSYLSINDGQIYDSQSLGAPALLSYFATF